MILSRRPTTRLPYPAASQLRFLAVASLYRLLGLLLAPAFRRRVGLDELSTARILILKPCCLGDVVFATPLIREIRRALPSAHLTFAVGAHSRPAVASHPAINALLDTASVGGGRYGLPELVKLAREIRARRFDACFVLERSALLSLLPLLAGVPIRVGIDSGGRGFSLNAVVPVKPSRPESELYLDLFRALGGKPSSGSLEYHPSTEAIQRANRIVETRIPGNRPFVLLHCAGGVNPGMALTRKRWPIASFRDLAQRIVESGAAVMLVGSQDDREVAGEIARGVTLGSGQVRGRPGSPLPRSLPGAGREAPCEEAVPGPGTIERGDPETGHQSPVPRSSPRHGERPGERWPPSLVIDLVGELSLDQLAALARRAAAYVGNDSGPSHLAEAAGANVVMLFGPSDPIVYGPRGRHAVSVTAGLWCSPCFENGRAAPCANVLCMPSISVDRVWNEVARFLTEREQAR